MKILYQQNPLDTIIELDDTDAEILRFKLIIEDLKDRIYIAHEMIDGENPDIMNALKELDSNNFEDETLQDIAKRKISWMIDELKKSHNGDCICVPMSCAKCYAESLLGIHTLKGLGKHQARHINNQFQKNNNIDEVINSLENYQHPVKEIFFLDDPSVFEKLCIRWTKEAKEAAEWLKVYKHEL